MKPSELRLCRSCVLCIEWVQASPLGKHVTFSTQKNKQTNNMWYLGVLLTSQDRVDIVFRSCVAVGPAHSFWGAKWRHPQFTRNGVKSVGSVQSPLLVWASELLLLYCCLALNNDLTEHSYSVPWSSDECQSSVLLQRRACMHACK